MRRVSGAERARAPRRETNVGCPLTLAFPRVILLLMDHDQRFKTLIREFFSEFLILFFARWTAYLDASAAEWLDKEIFSNPPDGPLHVLDLVARVPIRQEDGDDNPTEAKPSLVLIHIEIESPDRTTIIKPRLPSYYRHLRDTYKLPVLPIVVFLKVGLEGIGADCVVEEVCGLEVNRFQYLYVGLPGLNALEYLQGENWLGVALTALMSIPREQIEQFGAEALRRLASAPLTEQQRYLLDDCVYAYLPLDEAGKSKLEQILQTETYVEVRAMNQTIFEKGIEKGIEKGRREGIEKGIEKGRREGHMELVCSLIEKRFSPVSAVLLDHLEQLPLDELKRLALSIGSADSLVGLGLPEA